jgi:hypothetical protein
MAESLEPLEMSVQLTVIEDLGIKLYTRVHSVISEIISNSWDADSPNVDITLPTGPLDENSQITVEDWGLGMAYNQIRKNYLIVGRKRREEEGKDETAKGRPVMGRKGIGKLSVFGVAKSVEIETVQNSLANSFEMNIDDILESAKQNKPYYPKILKTNEKSYGKEQGTKVTLRKLKKTGDIDEQVVKRGVARNFSVIDNKFIVKVNGKQITNADKFDKTKMQYVWDVDEIIDDSHQDWKVSGWIGTNKEPLDESDIGIVIMARGKLLQSPTTFDSKVGDKYAYAYLTGEVHADFFDKKYDLISTDRQSAIWASEEGEALRKWGLAKLKSIASEWSENRRKEKEKVIREDPFFKVWLDSLPDAEIKTANKVITALTSSETLSDERRIEIARFMVDSFDQEVFHEMVGTLSGQPTDTQIMEIFMEWDLIEARGILRIVKGRLTAIKELGTLIDKDAKEVPEMHKFFAKWPWILDPSWTRWQHEVRYSKLLRDKFPDEKLDQKDRRIDFVSIGIGDTINVIELKRPSHKLSTEDMQQLFNYVAFVEENLGSDRKGYKTVAGYLVVGAIGTGNIQKAIDEAERNRRYVRTYEGLISMARRLHAEYEEKVEKFEKAKNHKEEED